MFAWQLEPSLMYLNKCMATQAALRKGRSDWNILKYIRFNHYILYSILLAKPADQHVHISSKLPFIVNEMFQQLLDGLQTGTDNHAPLRMNCSNASDQLKG